MDQKALGFRVYLTGRGLSKLVISRVIIRVTPFRPLITLLITYLLSPLPLQVGFRAAADRLQKKRVQGLGLGFRVRKQCARGGCAFCFRTEGAPTYRAQAVPQPPQLFSSGFRVHPPNPPSRGSFLLSASFRCSTHKQPQSTTKHRPVRSTKSVGPQQTTRTSNPCKGRAVAGGGWAELGWAGLDLFPHIS